jgi:hypothetical protein
MYQSIHLGEIMVKLFGKKNKDGAGEPVRPVSDQNEGKSLTLVFWGILVMSALIIILLPLLFGYLSINITFTMVALMIFGVIALLAVLTLAGKVYIDTDLACKEEALGLPSGSIRAIIALSLIIIFAIIAIFLYTQISPQGLMLYIPGNETFVYANGTAITNPNGIHIMTEPTQAQRDFSTQTLSTVSTLVVALAFYFGTKAATSGKKSKKTIKYSLSVTPKGELEKGKPLTFKVDASPKGADVQILYVDGDSMESFKKNGDEFVYTPSSDHKNVVKAVFAIKADGEVKATAEQTVVLESLLVTSKLTGKVKTGEPITFEFKIFSYENITPKMTISGDDFDKSVNINDLSKGNFTYTPTKKGSPRNNDEVHLSIKLDTKPPIEQMVKVEVIP